MQPFPRTSWRNTGSSLNTRSSLSALPEKSWRSSSRFLPLKNRRHSGRRWRHREALQEEIRLEDSTDLAFDLDVFFRQYSGDYADLYPDSHEEKERMAEELLSGQTERYA